MAAVLFTRRTEPDLLWCRLEVEVPSAALGGKRRVLDVTRRRLEAERSLRVRFREPSSLRGTALLLRQGPDQERAAWRYEPERERLTPIPWPDQDEQLGGTGLRWRDLWGEEPARWRYRLEDSGSLSRGGDPERAVEVLRVRAIAREGRLQRLLHLERGQGLPLLVEEARPEHERRLIWRSGWRQVGSHWFPATIRIVAGEEQSVIRVTRIEASAPPAHLDPSRFQRE